MSDDELMINVAPDWSSLQNITVQAANVYATGLGAPAGVRGVPDGILLALGYMRPPLFTGTPEQNAAALEALENKLRVEVLGSFTLSRERAEELMQILGVAITQYDEIARQAMNHA